MPETIDDDFIRATDAGSDPAGEDLIRSDGRARLYRQLVHGADASVLRNVIDWREERVFLFGRSLPVPRLVAYYGDHPYRYSGIDHRPSSMPPPVRRLCALATTIAEFEFNSVLCNLYRHGRDSMGYHRDNEPEIDARCIASLSFGATRRFKMRHRASGRVMTVDLQDGDLLLMLSCQEHWEHALPKTQRKVGERINLTFRRIVEL
jgi:alkylated DNA repair dioxygenase AlkB